MSITTSATERMSVDVREQVDSHSEAMQPVMNGRSVRSHNGPFPPSRVIERLLSSLPALALAFVFVIIWYMSTALGHVNPLFLPAPADVLSSLANGLTTGTYLSNMLVTVRESVFGFLLALVIALPLGYGLAKSRFLARAIHPYLAAGQAIPAIVIAPILILWLGYGLLPNVIVCMLVVFFPIVVNTILGVESIDHEITDAARVEGASGWSLLTQIEFPLALPAILAAVRTGLTLSITGALVAEFVQGGDQGLGSLVLIAKNQYNMPFLFATLVILAVLAAFYYGMSWLLTKLAEAIYF